MDNLKKNPISDPIMIAVFAIGAVLSAVQGYNKAKKQLNGEEKNKEGV